MEHVSDRWRRLLGEVWRFFAVAQLATWVSVTLFNMGVHGWLIGDAPMRDHAIAAYVLANTVGMIISYRGARGWVFPHRPPQHADGGRTAYVAINFAAMALPVGCLMISRGVLGLTDPLSDNISANVIGLIMAFGARFYLFRRYVFLHPVSAQGPAQGSAGAAQSAVHS